MSGTGLKGQVEVPAVLIWAAARRAGAEGRSSDRDQLARLLAGPTPVGGLHAAQYQRRAAALHDLASREVVGAVLPVERDALDVALAVRVAGIGTVSGFKLFSARSRIAAGFFRVRGWDVEYAGRAADGLRCDGELPELLSFSDIEKLAQRLLSYEQRQLTFQSPHDGLHVLAIAGGLRELVPRQNWPVKVSLSLWHAGGASEAGSAAIAPRMIRQLGAAQLRQQEAGGQVLAGLTPEVLLELTAASIQGRWLLIEGGAVRLFGQLPDLTEGGDSRSASFDPTPELAAFTLGATPLVGVPGALAASLHRLHPWCVPKDPRTWLEAIAQ